MANQPIVSGDSCLPAAAPTSRSIHSAAKSKIHAKLGGSPKKYWQSIQTIMKRSAAKNGDNGAEAWRPVPAPKTSSLTTLTKAARSCTACHLYRSATQTVCGEGPKGTKLMLFGEQPGDQEDLAGKPFIGPAGKLLDRALEESGDQSQGSLRHQHREAFQVGAARQAPSPPETEFARNRRLPALARSGIATR